MTKAEQSLQRVRDQIAKLQKKEKELKDIVDAERDDLVVKAMHEIDITREEAIKLARLIGDPRFFERVMELDPEFESRVMKKKTETKESEE